MSPEDRRRLEQAREERSAIDREQLRQWVWNLLWASEQLQLPQPRNEIATVMWLRLYATLTELPTYMREEIAWQEGLGDTDDTSFALAARRRIVAACETFLSAFSENERLYIHYRRDTEGHIWQDSYVLHPAQNQVELVEDRRYALLGGARLRHDDVSTRVRALIRRHMSSARNEDAELRIAVRWSPRIHRHSGLVYDAIFALRTILGPLPRRR